MAHYEHLSVYKESYTLLVELIQSTKNYPKEYRYSLGERIHDDLIELILDIYRANSASDKSEYINSILIRAKRIELFLRMFCDLKIITLEKYSHFIEKTNSISKQAQGWLQACHKPEAEPIKTNV